MRKPKFKVGDLVITTRGTAIAKKGTTGIVSKCDEQWDLFPYSVILEEGNIEVYSEEELRLALNGIERARKILKNSKFRV